MDLFRNDNYANVHLYALVALYPIGDEKGMQQVRRAQDAQRWPLRLQLVTLAALVDYCGSETYPMDREAGEIARRLIRSYTPTPRIEVGPMETIEFEAPQMEGAGEGQR